LYYPAVTFGASVQWHEAYDFAQNNGRFVVGGISGGAAGGWSMSGGHSAFSPKFGLGTPPPFSPVLLDL
jgi:hypothetical protein